MYIFSAAILFFFSTELKHKKIMIEPWTKLFDLLKIKIFRTKLVLKVKTVILLILGYGLSRDGCD